MFPIKLTEYRYVNPEAVLQTHFWPEGDNRCNKPLFIVVFENTDFSPEYVWGDEALEAFENWRLAYVSHNQMVCLDATNG